MDWDPTKPLGRGQIDLDARRTGVALQQELPRTMAEAIRLFGPLQVTHVIPSQPESGMWVPTGFITRLTHKPTAYFIGYDFVVYFAEYVAVRLVEEGQFRVLPEAADIHDPEIVCIADNGDVIVSDVDTDVRPPPFRVLCHITDLRLSANPAS